MASVVQLSLTKEQERLVCDMLRDQLAVMNYMVANDGMHQYYVGAIMQKTEYDQRLALADYLRRRGTREVDIFVDALVATGQYQLAKALKPTLDMQKAQCLVERNLASGDANSCFGSGRKGKKMKVEPGTGTKPLLRSPGDQTVQSSGTYRGEVNREEPGIHESSYTYYANNPIVIRCDTPPPGFDQQECYRHLSMPKGLALIINNQKFAGRKLEDRDGTEVDEAKLKRLLSGLEYDVRIRKDLTAQEILDAMSEFASRYEHKKHDSAVVVVLSHGDHGQIYGVDERTVPIEGILQLLDAQHCPYLRNKPKIFIFQACRGNSRDEGVDGIHGLTPLQESKQVIENVRKIPTLADILIVYATTPGYVSWRHPEQGSWLVQGICNVFSEKAHCEEIHHLFTLVNDFVSRKMSDDGNTQIPELCSRLRKKFYFLPGMDEKRLAGTFMASVAIMNAT